MEKINEDKKIFNISSKKLGLIAAAVLIVLFLLAGALIAYQIRKNQQTLAKLSKEAAELQQISLPKTSDSNGDNGASGGETGDLLSDTGTGGGNGSSDGSSNTGTSGNDGNNDSEDNDHKDGEDGEEESGPEKMDFNAYLNESDATVNSISDAEFDKADYANDKVGL